MGFDLDLEIKAKVCLGDIITYSQGYQKKQEYFDPQRWPEIKEKYLEVVSEKNFLKTIKLRLNDQGMLSIIDYQALKEFDTDDLRDYLLLLWMEVLEDDTIDIDYSQIQCESSVELEDELVTLPLYYGSSYKGQEELDVDYREIVEAINDLEDKFKCVRVVTELDMS